jgi:hypothetical protein
MPVLLFSFCVMFLSMIMSMTQVLQLYQINIYILSLYFFYAPVMFFLKYRSG